jgi:ankyrin repeat protein
MQDGNTPLHIAVMTGNCKAVAALIAADANIEAKNKVWRGHRKEFFKTKML